MVPNSGSIPKDPAVVTGQGCVPHLQDLHAEARANDQANWMVDALESSIRGNNSVRALCRRWSRVGGDNGPRVAVSWPQDFCHQTWAYISSYLFLTGHRGVWPLRGGYQHCPWYAGITKGHA
jgi:hypothetical protein